MSNRWLLPNRIAATVVERLVRRLGRARLEHPAPEVVP